MRVAWWVSVVLVMSFHTQAGLNSLANLGKVQLQQQVEGSDWYACGEEERRFCQDEFGYYHLSFYAELMITADTLHLSLLAPYTSHLLSEVQLNLRQDHFHLTRVSIGKQSFDVSEALWLAKSAKQRNQVDKALIQFLNRSPQETVREMHWVHANWHAILRSDGEVVELTLRPNSVRLNDTLE